MPNPVLVDPYGNPVRREVLTREHAAPSTTGVRQFLSAHPSKGLTPQRLGTILARAEQGDPTAYLELAEDIEEKDPHYLSVLSTRKRAVAQLEMSVVAASDEKPDIEAADLVRSWLSREELEFEAFDILDAIGKSYSVTEIQWETSARQWWPRELIWRDPRWFMFDPEDGRTLRLRTEAGWEPMAGFKYITHIHKAKSGLAIRGGLARVAAWMCLFKNYSLKDWVTFAEGFGQPLRMGKYPSSSNQKERDTLLEAVSMIGVDRAAIIPDSMMIELVEAKLSGNVELYERLCDWLDRQTSKAVLGQTLTTEVGAKGSYAAANVHDGVRGDIKRADAKQYVATLNRDLVRPLVDLNLGPPTPRGFGVPMYPRVKLADDTEADMADLKEMIDRGLEVEQSVVRDRFGMPEPADGAKIMRPAGGGQAPERRPSVQVRSIHAARIGDDDGIDDLVKTALEEWQDLVEPMVDGVQQLAAEVGSLEELRDRLAEAIQRMPVDRLAESLARSQTFSRMAGELEITPADKE